MNPQPANTVASAASWDWLGEPLPVDFANSVRRRGRRYEELFVSGADVERWSRHERPRVPMVSARTAAPRLAEVRALRDDVFTLLQAITRQQRLPPGPVQRINARAREHPVVPQVKHSGELTVTVISAAEPLDDLLARVADSTIRLLNDAGSALALCDAPSCGQFFIRARGNQRWCGPACGNRARVARHSHP
jgi:predicted RNA-binding Zn ribbon-like protein